MCLLSSTDPRCEGISVLERRDGLAWLAEATLRVGEREAGLAQLGALVRDVEASDGADAPEVQRFLRDQRARLVRWRR